MNNKNAIKTILIITFLMGLTACATTANVEQKKSSIDLVWPLPPEDPRIKFVDILSRSDDIQPGISFIDRLIGEEEHVYGLVQPYGSAVDSKGIVYVVDQSAIKIFDKAGKKYREISVIEGIKLVAPTGIAIASDGTVFVSDAKLKGVFGFDLNGKMLIALGGEDGCGESLFERPAGLAVDSANNRLYIVDIKKHHIIAFDLKGQFVYIIGDRGTDLGNFNYPTNITVDKEGNIYVSDEGNFRVQIFDSKGKVIKSIGNIGTRLGEFARPKGVAVDSEGHIYVIDAAFQNFQIFGRGGRLLMFVGGGGKGPGQFSLPTGIFIDSEDRIYIADRMNRRIQIFEYLGEKWRQRQAAKPAQPVQPVQIEQPLQVEKK